MRSAPPTVAARVGLLLWIFSCAGCIEIPRPPESSRLALSIRPQVAIRTDLESERTFREASFGGYQGEQARSDVEFLAIAGEPKSRAFFRDAKSAALAQRVFFGEAILGAFAAFILPNLPSPLALAPGERDVPRLIGAVNLVTGLVGAWLCFYQTRQSPDLLRDQNRMRAWAQVYNQTQSPPLP
jgi:hypothetical protein